MIGNVIALFCLSVLALPAGAQYEETPSCGQLDQYMQSAKHPTTQYLNKLKTQCQQELDNAPTTELAEIIPSVDLQEELLVARSASRSPVAKSERDLQKVIARISSAQTPSALTEIFQALDSVDRDLSLEASHYNITYYFSDNLNQMLADAQQVSGYVRTQEGRQMYSNLLFKISSFLTTESRGLQAWVPRLQALSEKARAKAQKLQMYLNYRNRNATLGQILVPSSDSVQNANADILWARFQLQNRLSLIVNDVKMKLRMGQKQGAQEEITTLQDLVNNFVARAPMVMHAHLSGVSTHDFVQVLAGLASQLSALTDADVDRRQLSVLNYYNQKLAGEGPKCQQAHPKMSVQINSVQVDAKLVQQQAPTIPDEGVRQFMSESAIDRLLVIDRLCGEAR